MSEIRPVAAMKCYKRVFRTGDKLDVCGYEIKCDTCPFGEKSIENVKNSCNSHKNIH